MPRPFLRAACVLVLLTACNAISGIGEFVTGELGPGDGGSLGDAASSLDGSTGLPDGSLTEDDAGSVDAGIDASTIEATLAPCAGGGVCLPNVEGWTPVVLSQPVPPPGSACPPAWPTETTFKSQTEDPCACQCKATNGSCEGPVDVASGAGCGSLTSIISGVSSNGACASYSLNLAETASFTARPTSAPTACTGTVVDQPRETSDFPVCTGATLTTDPACGSAEICSPPPDHRSFSCIRHERHVPCPAAFGLRMPLGTAFDDKRTCGATCECGPNQCADGSFTFYDAPTCPFDAQTRNAHTDGKCTSSKTTFAAKSLRYNAGSGCGVTKPATVMGTRTVEGAITLCCILPE